MMTPTWLNSIVREFGTSMGIENLSLNDNGVVALRFENKVVFNLEYAMDYLVLSMSVPAPQSIEAAKLLLSSSNPMRNGRFPIRTGFVDNPVRGMFMVRLDSADVTLGNLDAAMGELWRATENFLRRLDV
jgi:type III secretion system chaperone SycN